MLGKSPGTFETSFFSYFLKPRFHRALPFLDDLILWVSTKFSIVKQIFIDILTNCLKLKVSYSIIP